MRSAFNAPVTFDFHAAAKAIRRVRPTLLKLRNRTALGFEATTRRFELRGLQGGRLHLRSSISSHALTCQQAYGRIYSLIAGRSRFIVSHLMIIRRGRRLQRDHQLHFSTTTAPSRSTHRSVWTALCEVFSEAQRRGPACTQGRCSGSCAPRPGPQGQQPGPSRRPP